MNANAKLIYIADNLSSNFINFIIFIIYLKK